LLSLRILIHPKKKGSANPCSVRADGVAIRVGECASIALDISTDLRTQEPHTTNDLRVPEEDATFDVDSVGVECIVAFVGECSSGAVEIPADLRVWEAYPTNDPRVPKEDATFDVDPAGAERIVAFVGECSSRTVEIPADLRARNTDLAGCGEPAAVPSQSEFSSLRTQARIHAPSCLFVSSGRLSPVRSASW